MVKNTLKKSVSVLFCVAILASFFMVSPAKADDPWRVSITRNMTREQCWVEAGNHLQTGLSRDRIAVEIYAHSQNMYSRYLNEVIAVVGAGGVCVGGLFDPELVSKVALLAKCGGLVVGIGTAFDTYDKYFFENPVLLGYDSDETVEHYYNVWYQAGQGIMEMRNEWDKNKTIYSTLSSSKVVDISNNSNANGAKVQLWSDNGTSAQKFYILRTGEDNWYNIFKAGTFKCLDVTSGKAGNGVKVQLWNYNGTAAQDWELISVENGYYLKSRVGDGRYYLDVSGGKTADGTQIQIWTDNQTDAQRWKIE